MMPPSWRNTSMIVSPSNSEISECKHTVGRSPRAQSLKSNTTGESLSSTTHLIQQKTCQSSSFRVLYRQTPHHFLYQLALSKMRNSSITIHSSKWWMNKRPICMKASQLILPPTLFSKKMNYLAAVYLQKVDPPLLPVHRQKTNSWKQMNKKEDITMYESVFYITTIKERKILAH